MQRLEHGPQKIAKFFFFPIAHCNGNRVCLLTSAFKLMMKWLGDTGESDREKKFSSHCVQRTLMLKKCGECGAKYAAYKEIKTGCRHSLNPRLYTLLY